VTILSFLIFRASLTVVGSDVVSEMKRRFGQGVVEYIEYQAWKSVATP